MIDSRNTSVTALILFAIIQLVLVSPVHGQLIQPDPDESSGGVGLVLLPAVAYSSDQGLIGGLIGQRIDYGDGEVPFKNSSLFSILASTKGFLSFDVTHERIRSFNTNIRSRFDLRAERFLQQHYFGIGNDTRFDQSQWSEGYNNFEHREVRLDYTARRQLSGDGAASLDLLLILGTVYNSPKQVAQNSRFALESPYGSRGGWVFSPGVGLVVENRDNEFDTRRGMRYEARIYGSPSALSDYGYGKLRLDFRNYLPVFSNVVLAHQLNVRHTFGQAPFWDMPFLGSEYELRGYAEERFIGKSTWTSITEVRAWIVNLDQYGIRLGVHGFWDTGRVFSDKEETPGVFDNLKHTVGFGGAMSLFNPDFIFRGDVGFSDELYRIYIGIGYLF